MQKVAFESIATTPGKFEVSSGRNVGGFGKVVEGLGKIVSAPGRNVEGFGKNEKSQGKNVEASGKTVVGCAGILWGAGKDGVVGPTKYLESFGFSVVRIRVERDRRVDNSGLRETRPKDM